MTERDAILKMLVWLGRTAALAGGHNPAKPGDLVVETTRWGADPDAIGWLVAHGHAPYERDAAENMTHYGAPTREVWDVVPLSGRRGSGAEGSMRWENADFVALPEPVAELARAAFPPTERNATPVRWNTDAGSIPNREGMRIRVLAKDVGSITEFVYVVAKDGDGRHYLSTDGTLEGALPFQLVVAWRPEPDLAREAFPNARPR